MPAPPDAVAPFTERVILVDADDVAIGIADKLEAHRSGALHRAFSVFIFDAAGRMLLQRRALGKYHSGGLWSNACCGHPRPGEEVASAARRRLVEEMGIDCPLVPLFTFRYRVDLGAGMHEHEIDHVLVGWDDGTPRPDPGEVMAWRRAPAADVARELAAAPETFTPWFAMALRHAPATSPLRLAGAAALHRAMLD